MSSEIYYDRAYIRVGDRFIPVVNHGSSNCFDFDACGREVPEKQCLHGGNGQYADPHQHGPSVGDQGQRTRESVSARVRYVCT